MRTIGAGRIELVATAALPSAAVVGAVLPLGARFQACHRDRGVRADAVAVAATGVVEQSDGGCSGAQVDQNLAGGGGRGAGGCACGARHGHAHVIGFVIHQGVGGQRQAPGARAGVVAAGNC